MMTLEDKIYCLQRSNLPADLSVRLAEAEQLLNKDLIFMATLRVYQLIESCRMRGISLYTPQHTLVMQ